MGKLCLFGLCIYPLFLFSFQELDLSNSWSIWKIVRLWGGRGTPTRGFIVFKWSSRVRLWWCLLRTALTGASFSVSVATAIPFFTVSGRSDLFHWLSTTSFRSFKKKYTIYFTCQKNLFSTYIGWNHPWIETFFFN